MAKRFAHRLKPFGMGINPPMIMCVQGAVRREYASDADAMGEQALDNWHACPMHLCGSGYRTGATIHGDTAAEFWQWLRATAVPNATTWLVSIAAKEHAAFMGLWDLIQAREASVCGADPWARIDSPLDADGGAKGFVILESPPTIIQFRLADCLANLCWVDPANYGASELYKSALKASPSTKHRSEIPEFAWLDSISLPYQVERVNEWINTYIAALVSLGIGAIEKTAASQAASGFRRRYMRDAIYVHNNLPLLETERDALYSGRCECSFIGTIYGNGTATPVLIDDEVPGPWRSSESPIYHLDVNSLYPAVARNAALPVKLIACAESLSVDRLRKAVDKLACVARVYVETDTPIVPMRYGKHVVYPVGKFWTTICGPELALAFEFGKVLACGRFAAYETAMIYSQWVDDLYAARIAAGRRGDETMDSVIKSILNASFGKWAQRSRRWQSKPNELCMLPFSQWWQVNPESGDPEQWRSFAWAVERCVSSGDRKNKIDEPAESMPIITATIHALGRVRLWRLMEICGRNNVLYCDTDSIWTNFTGYVRLGQADEIDATALGKLKVVGKHTTVTWWGQKRYGADGELTVSGAPHGAMKDGDAFADVLRANPVHSYLWHDEAPGTERHIARVRLNLPYPAGTVGPTGEVSPLRVLDPAEDSA